MCSSVKNTAINSSWLTVGYLNVRLHGIASSVGQVSDRWLTPNGIDPHHLAAAWKLGELQTCQQFMMSPVQSFFSCAVGHEIAFSKRQMTMVFHVSSEISSSLDPEAWLSGTYEAVGAIPEAMEADPLVRVFLPFWIWLNHHVNRTMLWYISTPSGNEPHNLGTYLIVHVD